MSNIRMTQSERARRLRVSRQRVWQMDKEKLGLCITCGQKAAPLIKVISSVRDSNTLIHCTKHKKKTNSFSLKWYYKNRAKSLRKMKEYYMNNQDKALKYRKLYSKKFHK